MDLSSLAETLGAGVIYVGLSEISFNRRLFREHKSPLLTILNCQEHERKSGSLQAELLMTFHQAHLQLLGMCR
jgi:hypothetical protein